MTSYGYIIMGSCIISFNLNCIMRLKQFCNIATKVSSRKKCYYFWWSPWLLKFPHRSYVSLSSDRFVLHSSGVEWTFLSTISEQHFIATQNFLAKHELTRVLNVISPTPQTDAGKAQFDFINEHYLISIFLLHWNMFLGLWWMRSYHWFR